MGFSEFINNLFGKLGDLNEEVLHYKSEYEKLSDKELIRMIKKHQYSNAKQQMAITSVLRDRGYGSNE